MNNNQSNEMADWVYLIVLVVMIINLSIIAASRHDDEREMIYGALTIMIYGALTITAVVAYSYWLGVAVERWRKRV